VSNILWVAAASVISTLAMSRPCYADDDPSRFRETAEREFDRLASKCPPDRIEQWRAKKSEAFDKIQDKFREMEGLKKSLQRLPNWKEMEEIFPFIYLNSISEIQFELYENLIQAFGEDLVRHKANTDIVPLIDKLERSITSMKNPASREAQLQNLTTVLEARRLATRIGQEAPVMYVSKFSPRNSVFSTPYKNREFVIRDWAVTLAKLDELRAQLDHIEIAVSAEQSLQPKDPLPWLTIAIQMTYLLVAIGGWVKSYHGNSFWAIAILVVPSMLVSVFMIFYSEETIWNILRQSVVPSLFILYWIGNERKWWSRIWTKLRGRASEEKPDSHDGPAEPLSWPTDLRKNEPPGTA
jgi:hypothetical protein